jgi:hypothetical protein
MNINRRELLQVLAYGGLGLTTVRSDTVLADVQAQAIASSTQTW